MKKHWIGNLILLLAVNVVIKPLWIFGIDRNVQNIAGTEAYGLYFATFNFTVLLYILLDMGITSYTARTIAQYPERLPSYWKDTMILKLILSILYVFLCAIGAWWLQYGNLQWQLLYYLAANQILIAYTSYFRANLQGLHHFKTDTLLSILDRLLAILFCGALLYGWTSNNQLSVLKYAQIQTFSYAIAATVGFYAVWLQIRQMRKKSLPEIKQLESDISAVSVAAPNAFPPIDVAIAPPDSTSSPNISSKVAVTTPILPTRKASTNHTDDNIAILSKLYHIVRETLPFALMVLLMSIYTRIDAVLLAALLPDGATEAGIYASSYRLLDALNMLGTLAATQLLPHFTRLYTHPTLLQPILRWSSAMALFGSVVVATGSWVFRQPIMQVLYRDATPYYADVFGWLMWAFVPMSLIYVFGTLLTAKGNMRIINYIVFGGMLLNLSLNLWLIPIYKALGAAWATLGAQSLIAIAFIWWHKR